DRERKDAGEVRVARRRAIESEFDPGQAVAQRVGGADRERVGATAVYRVAPAPVASPQRDQAPAGGSDRPRRRGPFVARRAGARDRQRRRQRVEREIESGQPHLSPRSSWPPRGTRRRDTAARRARASGPAPGG